MKLHLPCRLRAAVMALFATAVISAPAYAADAPVYWGKINQIISDSGIATSVTLTGLGAFNGAFHYEKLANADLQNTDWTMTVTGTGFNTPSQNADETLPATFICFTGNHEEFPFSTYDKPTGDKLSQGFILGFGYGSGKKNLYFGTQLGWIDLGKVDAFTKEDISYELNMSYVDGKFSLNSLTINGSDFALSNDVKDLAINMPGKDKVFAGTWNSGCLTVVTSNKGTSDVTLLSPTGAEAWHVQDSVKLSEWAAWSIYEGASGDEEELAPGDLVHFVGNSGRIVFDETYTAMANTDTYTLHNKLSAGVDMADLKGGCSFGFEVHEGGTLTIKDGASSSEVTDADGNTKKELSGIFHGMSDGAGLRLYGAGDVIIECGESNTRTENMGATIIDGTGKLTIQNGANTVNIGDISAANSTVEVTGTGAFVIANSKAVNIKELIADSVTIANGGAVETLDVDSLTLESGNFQAGNGSLILSGLTVNKDATLNIKQDVTLVNATIDGILNSLNGTTSASNGSLTISGTANVNGLDAGYEMVTVSGGNLLAKDDIDAYKLTVSDGVVRANKIAVESDTLSASGASDVKATEVIAKKLTTDNITITPDSGTISLTNNVAITGSSVIAGAIDNAAIEITAPAALSRIAAPAGTILATDTLTNADLTINGSTVISDITKATSIVVNGQKTTANTIEADMVNTDGGHTIVANSIKANAITPNKQSYASVGAEMSGIRNLNNTLVDADTIKADYVGFGNIEVKNATVTARDLTLADATVLTNVDLKNSTISSHSGTVSLNEVKLGKNQAVGQTFTTLSDAGITSTGTPELVLKGSTTPDDLNLNFLTINDTEGAMDFTQGEAEYTIIEMGSAALNYAGYAEGERIVAPDVVLMNIASYTRSHVEIKTENGVTKLVIIGKEDKEGIVNELKQTDNQKAVMSVLDDVVEDGAISGGMKEIYDYVGNINLYTTEERQNMVSAASAASLTALAASQRDGIYESQKNLRNRIIQMGGITTGPTGNMDYVGLQAWIQADTGFNSIAATDDSAGYDYNTHGGTVGFNLNLAENLIVGAAFSASYGNLDARSKDKAEGSNDAYYLNLFARYQSNRWTHLFLFTAGFNEMEMERSITGKDFSGSQYVLDKQAKGSTDGYSLSAYYEGGYIFSLNEESTQILQPIVTLNLTSAHVNGYKETGSLGNAGVEYEGVDSFYGQVGIGARYQAVIHTTEYERNAVLELRAQVVQNFGDTTDEADVSFLGGGRTFTAKGTEVGTTGFQLGAGVSLPLGNQTTLFVDADADFRSEATSVHANLGLRYDF